MSEAADNPQSASQRYGLAERVRNTSLLPRVLMAGVGLGALFAVGIGINAVVQRFTNPAPEGPEPPPPNQIRVSAPAPFTMPQDTTAPAREPPAPRLPPAQRDTPPPPKPTAAQTMASAAANTTGMGRAPSMLLEPDQDWLKIGTGPAQAPRPGDQLTPADKAAAAFGQKPDAPKLAGGKATAVHDMMRTIRPGTRLFCTTQEAIDTTVGSGSFVCDVDRWVQAWDGVTPLIPPHSWIVVRYEELKNGRNRIFAGAGILTTPDGVVVSLGDPFGMPDGSGGVEGNIEDKTWQRLKEGLILDFAQSAFQTAENLASRSNQGNGNSSFNFNMNTNNTQQMVDRALEKNLNIPDVLRLPEGSHLSMTILHPIFMQDVVSFTMRAGAR